MPNDSEILFFTLLVICARESVGELNKWAQDVLAHEAGFKEQGMAAHKRCGPSLRPRNESLVRPAERPGIVGFVGFARASPGLRGRSRFGPDVE